MAQPKNLLSHFSVKRTGLSKNNEPSVTFAFGPVRFSYLNVFTPREGTQQYDAALLICKSNEAVLKALQDKVNEVYELSVSKLWGDKRIKLMHPVIHDGDEPKSNGDPHGEAYEGMCFINAKSTSQPSLRDKNGATIIDPEDLYSGCWGYANVTLKGYANSMSKGITCYLNGLMKGADDTPLGGNAGGSADFSGIEISDEDDL